MLHPGSDAPGVCQLFAVVAMSFACVLHFAMSSSAFHIMSSCASHLHTCSSHASEHFPRCPFCNPALLCHPTPPFVSFHVRVLNFLGMARALPSGLGTPPIDRLSSFVSFGLRLILQRLTEGPKMPRVCCSPTPFQSGPKPILTPSMLFAVRSRPCG